MSRIVDWLQIAIVQAFASVKFEQSKVGCGVCGHRRQERVKKSKV